MNGLDTIATQFYSAGLKYSLAIQPYALKLFFTLLLIDIIATRIQYNAEGQLDPSYFIGRMLKHILSGGFIYLMIVNAFPWMTAVMSSFSAIGASVSGLPKLSPQTVLQLGGEMASTIFDTPANASLMSNFEIAIVQSVCGFFVLLAFTVTAAMLSFTLVESYLAVGGVILLGFGGSRFTASAAEGYFPFVIRVGVRLLFFYLVLGVGVQLANQWNAALTAACKPVITAVPMISSYFVPPSKIMTTVCSGSISASDMLDFAGLSIVFAIMTIGIPHTVSSLVGGSIGLALAHAFEAAYIARTIVSPITSGLKKIHDGISGFTKGNSGTGAGDAVQSATQDILRQHQREKSADASASAATKVLNPFNGQPPGYNYRPPDGSNPRGPQLPPPPGDGSGSGGASLEYQPGNPGQHTRDIAVDVTGIQNGNGKGVS
jgi:type IV secretion system protein TrbL